MMDECTLLFGHVIKVLRYDEMSKDAAFKPKEAVHALSCQTKASRIAEQVLESSENA